MEDVRQTIRGHNRQLLCELSERAGPIVDGQMGADPKGLVAFLKAELVPHALGEERYFYPVLDRLIKAYGKPTATMSIDHEFIAGYIDWIEETAEELETADPDEHPMLQTLLQHLCLQLEALLQLHIAKEERVYLPLFDAHLTKEEQQCVLNGMHDGHVDEVCKHSQNALDLMQVGG